MHERVGSYFYVLPTQRQGRKVIWENIDKVGRRMIDQALPPSIRTNQRDDEMIIKTKFGSTFQVVGGDNFDAVVGSNPVGIVLSEYAIMSPSTWQFLSPILVENGGWIIFQGTPRGRNHLHRLVEDNKHAPNWFVSIKSWRDTGGIVTQAMIDEEVRAGMPRDLAEQEYGVSFNAPNTGAVYAKWILEAKQTGRVGDFSYNPAYPVETAWDLGRDGTAIWFSQRIRGSVHYIDYHEEAGTGFHSPAKVVLGKPYAYSRHVGPHDLSVVDFMSDAKRIDQARNHGIHFAIAPKLLDDDAEPATRAHLGTAHFNAGPTAKGIAALEHYHREYDEDTRSYSKAPKHDWSSHGSKAMQYAATTPTHLGIIPVWAKDILVNNSMYNHNGGPPMDDHYDPLAEFRGGR